jgi:hypothetical protein
MKLVEMVGRFAQASDLGELSESAVDRMPTVRQCVPSGRPPISSQVGLQLLRGAVHLRSALLPRQIQNGPGQPDGGDFSSAWRAW